MKLSEDEAAGSSSQLCHICVCFIIIFLALILKHILLVAEILSSSLEKKAGCVGLRPSRPVVMATIKPEEEVKEES